jgi:hypothetical protein
MKFSTHAHRSYPVSAMFFLLACGALQAHAAPALPVEHQHMASHDASAPPLTQAGNDIFGAIQEAVRQLEADPTTDWKKVNLEALRQHLLDIRHFTEDVEVLTQKPIDKGIEIIVRATNPDAIPALDRAYNAHPKALKADTGWDMVASKDKDKYKLQITTDDATQLDKLRGLGYIGLMAVGNHHALHHWALARGQAPH